MEEGGAVSLSEGQSQSLSKGFGLPPFRVRDADQVNKDLGFLSVPLAPTGIPIYTFVD